MGEAQKPPNNMIRIVKLKMKDIGVKIDSVIDEMKGIGVKINFVINKRKGTGVKNRFCD